MASLKQRGMDAGLKGYQWLEHRLGLIKPLSEAAAHPTPASNASWWYVFGSAATVLLVLQVITGILLALVYSPTANDAYGSLLMLNHNIPLGWYLRAIHGWGSDFMIAIVLIHMAQVFLFGAYKFPRELTWIVGMGLLLLTLGMAFTGQVMRFDQDAYWGLGIGASIVSRVPFIGSPLVHLVLGGPIIGGPTLSRFFTLHVFIIPGLLLAGVGVHIWMTLFHGVSEWPMPGRLVRKATYEREYKELTHKTGIPFVPDAAWKDAVFATAILLSVMACAFYFGPIGPGGPPTPPSFRQRPNRFRFPVDLFGSGVSSTIHRNTGDAHRPCPRHRGHAPAATFRQSGRTPLGPPSGGRAYGCGHCRDARRLHEAWHLHTLESHHGCVNQRLCSAQIPARPHATSASGRSGAAGQTMSQLPLSRGCGRPSRPGTRLHRHRMTEDQIIRQVLQGGGNMPSYGNALNPSETKALVSFLTTLRGNDLPPAIDPANGLTNTSELHIPQPVLPTDGQRP